jgi:hypothetical protein
MVNKRISEFRPALAPPEFVINLLTESISGVKRKPVLSDDNARGRL